MKRMARRVVFLTPPSQSAQSSSSIMGFWHKPLSFFFSENFIMMTMPRTDRARLFRPIRGQKVLSVPPSRDSNSRVHEPHRSGPLHARTGRGHRVKRPAPNGRHGGARRPVVPPTGGYPHFPCRPGRAEGSRLASGVSAKGPSPGPGLEPTNLLHLTTRKKLEKHQSSVF